MNERGYDTKHLKVLDGIRALAIIIIVWYHLWQQSWLTPTINNLAYIPKHGYLLVDMMILISGFCLFVPYARWIVYKEKMPSTRDFYLKRIARIFPSYYIALIVFLSFNIIFKNVTINGFFFKDLFMHIFFVHNWSPDTLLFTN